MGGSAAPGIGQRQLLFQPLDVFAGRRRGGRSRTQAHLGLVGLQVGHSRGRPGCESFRASRARLDRCGDLPLEFRMGLRERRCLWLLL